MSSRAGLVQRKVKYKTRGGKMAQRTMWVQANGKKPVARVKGAARPQNAKQGQPGQPGFLRRHAGKLVMGAAGLALLAANRHKLSGAARGVGLALNAHKFSGSNAGLQEKARDAFRAAKVGYQSNRGMDRIDSHIARAGVAARALHGEAISRGKAMTASAVRDGIHNYRRQHGAALTEHLAKVGGEAAASHIGSRFGQVAGTAVGGAVAGPVGAGVGGFLGGHAGSFLAGRHAAPHIARGAAWAAQRMSR